MTREPKTRIPLPLRSAGWLWACHLLAAVAAAGTHPSLLLDLEDVVRIRHACGLGPPPATGPVERAGARAADFQALRDYMNAHDGVTLLPGEVSAAAFLHLVDPDDPRDPDRLLLVTRALREPPGLTHDPFESVLALDWCWPDLESAARNTFLRNLAGRGGALEPGDSPLDHRTFSARLTLLAAALAFDETDLPDPLWRSTRHRVLSAARTYFQQTWPVFVSWRGAAPTSPTAGPAEERDAALATELAARLLGRNTWSEPSTSIARWLEHYVYASFTHPALQHHFIRDDGSDAPLSPVPRWEEMFPLTAHLIACRTRDPSAAFIARRVAQRLQGPAAEPLARPWRWIPLVFDARRVPCCDFGRLPPTRNFGGAVVFRYGTGLDEVGVWIEAGQPRLRRRQHADAGHFLIYSRGHLAVGGGDDVAFEAVPSKAGYQRLGSLRGRFDFDQYFTATIAHNALLLWDRTRVLRWQGQRYEAVGGQRLVQDTCTAFSPPLDGNPRQTARQLALGQRGPVSYLALDLAPAYDPPEATRYFREFLLWREGALVVIDRVLPAEPHTHPIWVLNIPSRPTADANDLDTLPQRAGSDPQAGVWQADEVRVLRWSESDGALRLVPLRPEPRRLRIVGGPAETLEIPQGRHTGRRYVGGSAESFEHLVRPAVPPYPPNAWYRLGAPTLLGSAFGQSPHWGRLEIEPAARSADGEATLFLTVLFIEDRLPAGRREAAVDETGQGRRLLVTLRIDRHELALDVPSGLDWGGRFRLGGNEWTDLPDRVEPDLPLPAEPATSDNPTETP